MTLCFSVVKCLTSADSCWMLVTAAQTDWRKTTALFKFVERGLATRSPATVTSVTPGVAMLCHQRVDDAWRALWPPNVTHARRAFTNAVEVKGGPRARMRPRERPPIAPSKHGILSSLGAPNTRPQTYCYTHLFCFVKPSNGFLLPFWLYNFRNIDR